MAKKTLNLTYATDGLGFFSKIESMKTIISNHKKTNSISEFTQADEIEIGRGSSYAVFPELVVLVKQGGQITIGLFRECLNARGIADVALQNKILNMTLQSQAGLQFAMGKLVDGLFFEHDFLLVQNPNYQIAMEVMCDGSANLIFKGVWEDPMQQPREPAVAVSVKINISPDMVAITGFNMTKLSDASVTTAAYDLIEKNQQNIIMAIITFIRHFFGFNSELRLEEKQEGDLSWAPGAL